MSEAEKYLDFSLAAYYSEGQEFGGDWGGTGAELLGLHGRVDDVGFKRLVNNLHPLTGEKLTPRTKSDRRPGFDMVWNVPKSVALAYAYTKDERIVRMLRETVQEVRELFEPYAATRVRAGGQDCDRITGNLVTAEAVHFTARPENGLPDPHLHLHLYIPNTTFDPVEKRWKALEFGKIWEDADCWQRAATQLMAEKLRAIGLEIIKTDDAYEIAGISRDLNEKFSRRSKTIEEEAIRRGITDPAQKHELGVLTREKKVKDLRITELEPFWWSSLLPEEREALEGIKAVLQRSRAAELSRAIVAEAGEVQSATKEGGRSSQSLGQRNGLASAKRQRFSLARATRPVSRPINWEVEPTEHDRRAVELAIAHTFERASVVTEQQLIAEASRNWCVDKTSLAGIWRAVEQATLLRQEVDGKTLVTTAEVYAEENRLIDRCLFGKFKHEPINEFWQIEDEKLNAEQRAAVEHLLTSQDFVTGLAGWPGVGKTTLLHEVRRGVEGGYRKFLLLTPLAATAHDALPADGFRNAETVAQLLVNERLQHEYRGAVWLVDEAGLLSTRQADQLLALAEDLGARVMLVGGIGQHHAVERGQAFNLLRDSAQMAVAEVREIQRQKGLYKEVVEHALKGEIAESIEKLDGMGNAFEMPLAERKVALANDYIAAIESGKTALVVAPTHAECDEVTEGIRAALKERNKLGRAVEWDTLRNLCWTDAQKSDAEHYSKGLVLQINAHVKGFALGEQVEVIGVRGGMVRVRSHRPMQDRIRALPLSHPRAFSVYERDSLEVCEGDLLRVTANGKTPDRHRLDNGSIHRVDHIAHDGKLVLENGWRIGKEFLHLDWGYAVTSHAAQGKTVDVVLSSISAQMSAAATDLEQFRVTISRGREGKLYTEDLALLRENASRVRERPMATEIFYGKEETNLNICERGETQREQMRTAEHLGQLPEMPVELTWVPERGGNRSEGAKKGSGDRAPGAETRASA